MLTRTNNIVICEVARSGAVLPPMSYAAEVSTQSDNNYTNFSAFEAGFNVGQIYCYRTDTNDVILIPNLDRYLSARLVVVHLCLQCRFFFKHKITIAAKASFMFTCIMYLYK